MGRLLLNRADVAKVTDMDILRLRLGKELCDFTQTWHLQRQLHADVVAGARPNTVLLLEHDDVITAGRRTNQRDRPTHGPEIVDVDRGGKLTWHGPGQLVVYPIVKLLEPVDVVAYVRALEEAVIRLAEEHRIEAIRVVGRSGVWVQGVPDRKLAAVGVRVARGVTMHGVAINVNPDLGKFSQFTPCGIPDVGVTSISIETGIDVTPDETATGLTYHLRDALAPLCRSTDPGDQAHQARIASQEEIPAVLSAMGTLVNEGKDRA